MVRIFKEILAEQRHHFKLLFRKKKYEAKIFCIGYNKTGTTTLGKSLELLGYRNSSFNKKVWRKYYKKGKIDKVLSYTAKFDSFDDLPWLKEDMIPLLDKTFPGSKFIYLERDELSWKSSLEKWSFKRTGKKKNVDEAYQKFLAHKEFVMNYFKDFSSDRFIILNVSDQHGFKKLGDFLHVKVPHDHFPHYNKTSEYKNKRT